MATPAISARFFMTACKLATMFQVSAESGRTLPKDFSASAFRSSSPSAAAAYPLTTSDDCDTSNLPPPENFARYIAASAA